MGFFGFGSKSKNTSQAYDKKTGSDYSGIYKSPKSSAGSNFLMDIGVKQKTSTYYSELPSRQARSRAAAEAASSNKSDGPSAASKPRQLTAAELKAQRKAEELARRRTEGAASRKKFEKQKGEKRIAKRKRYMKLLNV
jgi:hypothetical protein